MSNKRKEEKYLGFKNYETCSVALYINSNDEICKHWQKRAGKLERCTGYLTQILAKELKEVYGDPPNLSEKNVQ